MEMPPFGVVPPATPALVVIEPVLSANLSAMQTLCDRKGVALRAHAKMHKCSALARRQVAQGAVGVCAQTLGEAVTLLAAGIADVLLTSPPPLNAAARVMEAAALGRLAVVVDDRRQVLTLAEHAVAHGRTLDVLIDVDLGQHRTGVRPHDAPALAATIAGLPGLRLKGLQAYVGHIQHLRDAAARRSVAAVAHARLKSLIAELEAAGHPIATVTGGGTGTFAVDLEGGVFTELQAGSYALMDVEYGACEGPDGGDWPFRPALFLAATVVSDRHPSHVVVDAGLKALSTDGPFAKVAGGAAPGSVYRPMGDEHGAIFHPLAAARLKEATTPLAFSALIDVLDAELAHPPGAPALGDVVWLQPGHCDPTINLHDALFVASPGGGLERWAVDARRATPAL